MHKGPSNLVQSSFFSSRASFLLHSWYLFWLSHIFCDWSSSTLQSSSVMGMLTICSAAQFAQAMREEIWKLLLDSALLSHSGKYLLQSRCKKGILIWFVCVIWSLSLAGHSALHLFSFWLKIKVSFTSLWINPFWTMVQTFQRIKFNQCYWSTLKYCSI